MYYNSAPAAKGAIAIKSLAVEVKECKAFDQDVAFD